MPQPSPGRLRGIRRARFLPARVLLVLVCAVAALTGPIGGATGDDGKQQVNLSLKPVGQPGSYFSLSMAPGQSRQLKAELGNHGAAAIAARTYAADAYTLINGGVGAKDRDSTPTGATAWLSYPTEVLQLPAGQASVRTFTLTVPAGAAPGDYVSGLVLENDVPIQGSGSVALNQIVRQVIAVAIHVSGPLQPALDLGAASHMISATGPSYPSRSKTPAPRTSNPPALCLFTTATGKPSARPLWPSARSMRAPTRRSRPPWTASSKPGTTP
ncbi:hypothetical protein QFZ79_001371 [Arthrobacter sp. V4I6]|uniref:WxL protein peptidoglycan domain-containing protein n=1 Tax=Arthrobacter sp. V1I7 TaxID=3042274 RepID=UPI002789B72A|nr:hypothetical protein [Arthrobacter sp. V1I7]MDQ0853260.1 hypothetical protein [Arthrobacter sp. V4I6]